LQGFGASSAPRGPRGVHYWVEGAATNRTSLTERRRSVFRAVSDLSNKSRGKQFASKIGTTGYPAIISIKTKKLQKKCNIEWI
jgi:hypothetical protein